MAKIDILFMTKTAEKPYPLVHFSMFTSVLVIYSTRVGFLRNWSEP